MLYLNVLFSIQESPKQLQKPPETSPIHPVTQVFNDAKLRLEETSQKKLVLKSAEESEKTEEQINFEVLVDIPLVDWETSEETVLNSTSALAQDFDNIKLDKHLNEPRPKARGMIWGEFRTPPKFGVELPGPKGPGFRGLDEKAENPAQHPISDITESSEKNAAILDLKAIFASALSTNLFKSSVVAHFNIDSEQVRKAQPFSEVNQSIQKPPKMFDQKQIGVTEDERFLKQLMKALKSKKQKSPIFEKFPSLEEIVNTKPGVKKAGPWVQTELIKLIYLEYKYRQYNHAEKWKHISQDLGTRSLNSCKERFNFLNTLYFN